MSFSFWIISFSFTFWPYYINNHMESIQTGIILFSITASFEISRLIMAAHHINIQIPIIIEFIQCTMTLGDRLHIAAEPTLPAGLALSVGK